jgi:hypothetical protein
LFFSNVHVSKYNEDDKMKVDVHFSEASSKFKSTDNHILAGLDAKFTLSLLLGSDTTFIKNKHLSFRTDLDYNKRTSLLLIQPTVALLEGSEFNAKGTIDMRKNMELDLLFDGHKPNFDLFLALAPEELAPALKRYDNNGKIFFEASIKGESSNGKTPAVNARFGCEKGFFVNTEVNKKVDDLNFSAYFTNGSLRSPQTMEFGIQDFTARPESGIFKGNLVVKNFESPDIDLQLTSDFDLNFLAKFFNLTDLYDLQGKVELTTNFKDIIDLDAPEKSIEKLNESYFTELKIENLSFGKESTSLPIKDVDLYAEMTGHEARISYCNVQIGQSDLSLTGSISDLPAVLHHTDIPVTTKLDVKSKLLDIYELTGADSLTSFNEQIKNFSAKLHFQCSAKAITESPNLPVGEFFIDELFAQMTHYPHVLHDFKADVYVDKEDFRVIDFEGFIDQSDFQFSGKLAHYDLWFQEQPRGDTRVEFSLTSDMLQLRDIFSYRGANYVPEDYRGEEFDQLSIKGYSDLHFQDSLASMDITIDHFGAKMKLHAMRFERFKGRVHLEKENLVLDNFSGQIGRSDFSANLHYYMGSDDALKKRTNKLELRSKVLDFDQLFQYQLPTSSANSSTAVSTTVDHDAGFNIYELPFSDMTFDVNIDQLRYHKYRIDELQAKAHITPNHYLYLDDVRMKAAGGRFSIKGYFNGSDPKKIYFSPDMQVEQVDLDQLMFKFDNFGQDHLVSENLHGKLTGKITGIVRMHKDMVPIIDQSELHMDLEVVQGKLENFAMLEAMSDFFRDKNLKLVSFDTLSNHLDLDKGKLSIPNMSIQSSLGYLQIAGGQDLAMNMDYYVRVPWRLVTDAAASKLFGKKAEEVDPSQVDAIQYEDKERRVRFVNVRIKGNPDDYSITLEKQKKEKKEKKSS